MTKLFNKSESVVLQQNRNSSRNEHNDKNERFGVSLYHHQKQMYFLFESLCNPHLCSASIFGANKAYLILLTECGSGEERRRDTKSQGAWSQAAGTIERGSETKLCRLHYQQPDMHC